MSEQLDEGQKRVVEDTEMAVEAQGAACIVACTAQDTMVARDQSRDSTKGQCGSHGSVFMESNLVLFWVQ